MARTPAQRGRIGQWLMESRLARGYRTQERARREIERLTGWKIPVSVYSEWESGTRVPSEDNQARLAAFFGNPPTTAASPGDQAAVIAALDRQTAAIERQAAMMDRLCELLGQTLTRQAESRDAAAIFRVEAMEVLGAIEQTLGLAGEPGEAYAERPADVRRTQ